MGNALPIPNERMTKLIETAKLTKREQRKLYKCFRKVDRDGSGTVDAEEFFAFIGEPKTDFTDGLFDLIDTDSSRELDFYEFASALVTFGCFTSDELLKCASHAAPRSLPSPMLHQLIAYLPLLIRPQTASSSSTRIRMASSRWRSSTTS